MTIKSLPARILATAVTCIGLGPIPLLADTGPEKPADDQDLTEIVVTATGTREGTERTGLLCAYPKHAKWNGVGDQAHSSSFICVN
jgi:hypothetical protein